MAPPASQVEQRVGTSAPVTPVAAAQHAGQQRQEQATPAAAGRSQPGERHQQRGQRRRAEQQAAQVQALRRMLVPGQPAHRQGQHQQRRRHAGEEDPTPGQAVHQPAAEGRRHGGNDQRHQHHPCGQAGPCRRRDIPIGHGLAEGISNPPANPGTGARRSTSPPIQPGRNPAKRWRNRPVPAASVAVLPGAKRARRSTESPGQAEQVGVADPRQVATEAPRERPMSG